MGLGGVRLLETVVVCTCSVVCSVGRSDTRNNIPDVRQIAVKDNFMVSSQMTETNFSTFSELFSTINLRES